MVLDTPGIGVFCDHTFRIPGGCGNTVFSRGISNLETTTKCMVKCMVCGFAMKVYGFRASPKPLKNPLHGIVKGDSYSKSG